MKLVIYKCDEHDQQVVELDGEVVIQNDYSNENLHRLAEHLGWEVEVVSLSFDEYSSRFS